MQAAVSPGHRDYDVIIVGAGVVGAMVARFLSRFALDILWIEKEADVCTGATSANSAVIHGGYDAVPGSLKAEMNVRGNAMWDRLAQELHFSFDRCGTYVVAVGVEERQALEEQAARGQANGVPVEIISGDEMRRREPFVTPETSGALYCPTGGICDPWGATIAAAENAVTNGVTLLRNTRFEDFIWAEVNGRSKRTIAGIRTNQGDFAARWVINAAGVHADTLMHRAGSRPGFKITPRRGEYYVIDRNQFQMDSVLFRYHQGQQGHSGHEYSPPAAIVGPNAEEIEDREDTAVTALSMHEIWDGAQKLVPSLSQRAIDPLRRTAPRKQRAVAEPGGCIQQGLCHRDRARGARPHQPGRHRVPRTHGCTGHRRARDRAPARGRRGADRKGHMESRAACPSGLPPPLRAEQADLVAREPSYGRVICRCEMVTEGEIVAEIHAPILRTPMTPSSGAHGWAPGAAEGPSICLGLSRSSRASWM